MLRPLKLAIVTLIFLAVVAAAKPPAGDDAQTSDADALLAPGQKETPTGYLECYAKGRRSRRAISPLVISRKGRRAAYVEVVATKPSSPVFGAECANTTRLLVSHRGGPFRPAILIEPKRVRLGNGMKIVDWSRDSNLLLLEEYDWQWASDAPIGHHVVIFEPASGATHELEMDVLTDGRSSERCTADVRVLGFTADNGVVVEAQIFTGLEMGEELEDVAPEERCEEVTETWVFDAGTWEGRKSAEPAKTIRYGRVRRNKR